MDDDKAYELAEKQTHDMNAEMATCLIRFHTGFIVIHEGSAAIVNDEFDYVTHLPSFITNEEQARQYLGSLNSAWNDGNDFGRHYIKERFQRLMGLESKKG